MNKLLFLSLASLFATDAMAGGYRISMQGQRQLAMGHTGVAVIGQNAESIFFNPASGVFLNDKFSFSAGATALVADTRFQNTIYNWQNSTRNVGTPFYLYGNYKLSDKVALGLAVYTPYGSAVAWDQDWEGAHLVNNIDLKAIFVQPTVSVKITKDISLGAGLIFVTGGVEFNRNLSRNMTDEKGNRSDVTVDASGVTSWGYNLGLTARLDKHVTFGANYRSHIDMKAKNGAVRFNDMPSFLKTTFTDGTFNASMPLPAELTLGFSYQINPKWLVAIDYNRAFWGEYKSLDIDFTNPAIPDSHNPRNYKDSSTYRIGGQFVANEKWSFRAGTYYDESPVGDGYFAPETPRNSSLAGTLGFTYKITPRLAVDFSAAYLHFNEVDNSYDYFVEDGRFVSFGGTYRSSVASLGIGLSYNF